MPRRVLLLVLLALAALAVPTIAHAATYPTGFQEETLISGLSQPMAVDWTPDGRRIVIEKSGIVKVAAPGATTATPIAGLDLRARVNSNHDRGLLGLEVDQDYAINNYVYLLYTYDLTPGPTTGDSGGPAVSQLLRVKLSLTNQVIEEKVILGTYTSGPCPAPANNVDCIPSDYDSHSIGTVRQFRDGTLFVGSGDGSSYNEAEELTLRTLDERSMSGKILNVDRDGKGLATHPFCPSNTNLDDVCTKVWVRGLRNPFRFEVRYDRALNIGDVGWGTTEELNVATHPGGQSFGWPCYEGSTRTGGYQVMPTCQAEYAKPAGTHTNPSLSWCHCGGGGSAIAGPTYMADQYPAGYRDTTFYADYVLGWVKRAVPNGSGGFTSSNFATGWLGVQLTQDPATGDIVYVTPGNFSNGQGSVRAIRYTAGNKPPVAKLVADKTSGLAPLAVNFDATTSTDADNDPLTYSWTFGDGTTSTAAKPAKTFTTPGTYTVKLTVSDGRGATASDTTTVTVGNSTPSATITSPANESSYRDGQSVTLAGTGTDPQDGPLAGSQLRWQVLLHHGNHTHPFTELIGSTVTFTPLTDHDADSYYEIRLTAVDSAGLTDVKTIVLRPETVGSVVRSEPPGATLSWAGMQFNTTRSTSAAIGFRAGVDAAETFTSNGTTYAFDRWSDGGARAHVFTVPSQSFELVAHYKPVSTQPPGGPVLALGFDETSGTTSADKSGRGNTATLSSSASFTTAGRNGGALNVTGAAGSWATVADSDSLDLTNAMTLEAWVKPRSRSAWRTVLMKELSNWQSYVLYSAATPYNGGNGEEPVGFVNGDGVRGPAPLPLNAWSHLATTFDGTTQRLYVDGTLVASRPSTAAAQVGTGALRIGGNDVWGEQFDGLIDDVRVYDRAISAAEVVADRDTPVGGGTPQPQPGPVPIAAYGFEETTGATTADTSPYAANGTVSGATRIAAGKKGRALDFDGVDDRVVVPHASQFAMTGPFTLSAWVKPDKVDGWRTVLLKPTDNSWQSWALYAAADPYLGSGTGGEPIGFVGGEGARGPSKLPTGTWSHLAFVYSQLGERLYVDGTLVAERTFATPPSFYYGTGVNAAVQIGGSSIWGEWFDGAIDEVRIFDRALSATQLVADKDRVAATARASAAAAKVTMKRGGVVTAKAAATRTAKAKAKKAKTSAKRVKVLRGKDAAVSVTRKTRKLRKAAR